LGTNRSEPWFITGDFNDIIEPSEKEGGIKRPVGSFVDLRSFMSTCDLFDLRHSGNFLSWRGTRNEHLVHCRLDRAMSNTAWAEEYPSGRSDYLRFEGSDHRPLITHFDLKKKKKKGLFRYDRRLRDNEEVRLLISEAWSFDDQESVEEKINRCRASIIRWSREAHQNSQKLIEDYKQKLDKAMSSPTNSAELISSLNNTLLLAYKAEEAFWKQRNRQLWLALGDKNTEYFHAATRGRKAINKFSVIENAESQPVYKESEILIVFTEYFHKLFTSQEGDRLSTVNEAILPRISNETNEILIAMPSSA